MERIRCTFPCLKTARTTASALRAPLGCSNVELTHSIILRKKPATGL
ncbi:hypothetical protein Hamer_G013089 [Homarus americanus]|uniref:Uncharacterized protein n=1 Tax=Homarus americanus TaxID=6706 RepID=A0A8J5MVW1_HOMAM|nr:hypothetical protein Hamer_G013089 [Homarus americanus]